MQTNHTGARRNIFSPIITDLAFSFAHISLKTGLNSSCYFSALFVIILTFCSFTSSAATYYVAPNGDDAASGNISNPLATLNKAWTKVMAGDLVYMRGGTYTFSTKQVLTGKNGTAANLIKVWAYTGEIPVIIFSGTNAGITLTGNYISFKGIEINGLATLTGWTNVGNGIYSKSLTCQAQEYAPSGSTNMVTINGVNTPLGRYPNSEGTNGGYLTIDSYSGTSSITDAALPSSPNFNGGEVVVRRAHWVLDRSLITNHSSQTITYTAFPGAKTYDITAPRANGYGYFIQNHISTLDQLGEWCYNGTTLSMYFGTNNPTSYVIKASTVSDLIFVSNSNYVTFENMTFQGGNSTSFKSSYSNYVTINNCNINYSGKYGILCHDYSSHFQILNSKVNNSNSCAIRLESENNNALISGNSITNSGVLHGMVAQIRLNGICDGISSYSSDNTIVEYNKIINSGYNGIKLDGIGPVIRNNYVDTFCSLKDDGGGIYFQGGNATVTKIVKNNIVLNGIGANSGTTEWGNPNGYIGSASGIYMDDNTDNVEISYNTVANCCYDGINIHNALRINAHDNVTYNNRNAQIGLVHDSHGPEIRNASVKNNVCASTLTHESMGGQNVTQKVMEYGTVSNDITLFGTINNNYYISPLDNDPKFFSWSVNNSGYGTIRTFSGWKTYSGQDANSQLSPVTVPNTSYVRFEYNDTTINKVVSLGATYIDAKGVQYVGSITLLPYTSAILMRTSAINNQTPVIQNQGFQLNENSPNGTVVGTVVASDPDAGQTLTYSILSGNTNGAFAISTSTGALTVAISSALNFETITSFALVVKVLDNGVGNLSNQATITVTLVNTNEPPVINNQNFSVVQLSPNGTQVGTVQATDPDAGQTRSFLIISGNTSNAFLINSSTGVISVATSTALNVQVNPVFNLNIRVTDNGTGNISDDAVISINVTQSTNQPPVINSQTFSVNSGATNGTLVDYVVATDPDAGQTLAYSILSGNSNGAFAINASNGAITVANSNALVNDTGGTQYSLFQSITPSGSSTNYIGTGTAPLEVGMKFKSNTDGIISGFRFYKGAGAQGTHIGNLWSINGVKLASATFTGETSSGWQTVTLTNPIAITANTIYVVSYFSSHGDYVKSSPYFTEDITIGPLTGLGWTTAQPNGVYKYNASSAFPDNNTYIGNSNFWADVIFSSTAASSAFALVVKVQDNGTGSLSSQANIAVNLINGGTNNAPAISNQTFSINEIAPVASTIGSIVALDPDAGQLLTYSILSGNTNNAFAINSNTGALTVANSAILNYEVTPTFSLAVNVQDNGTGNLSSQATITINLLNVNEPPLIYNQNFNVVQTAVNGTLVGSVVGSDPDAGQTLAYSILSGNTNGAFTINGSTGTITVANSNALLYGTGGTQYSLFQSITPSASSTNYIGTGTAPLEVGMKFKSNADGFISGFRFYKGAGAQGTHIGNLWSINGVKLASATFTGETASGWQTVSLTNPVAITANTIYVVSYFSSHGDYVKTAPYFTVDITNGPLTGLGWTTNQPNGVYKYSASSAFPDNNTYIGNSNFWADVIFSSAQAAPSSFALVVKAQDNGNGNLSSQANVSVNVSSVNGNNPPVISNQTFFVNENSPIGSVVGSVVASDPDAGQVLSFSILSGNTNNAFTINTSSGSITVTNSSELNFETTSSFELVIKVQDNGTGNLSSQAYIYISLLNGNDPPVISNQTFHLNANSQNGTTAGIVAASDPDAGQLLTYSILSGNTNNAFAINSSTGAITVANSNALNSGSGTNYSVFQAITPAASAINYIGTGSAPLEVGMKFRSNVNGFIYGFRFYKGAGSQGTHIGNLWSISGTNLATATFTGETASGWQTVTLSNPVAITANTLYVVSYFSQHGDYVKSVPYFTADIVNGPLTGLGWTADQPNGVYRYSATSAFPNNNSYITNSNFWADVIFSSTPPPSSFALVVKVQDNGTGNLSNQSTITINLQRELKSMLADAVPISTVNKMRIYPNPVLDGMLNVQMEETIGEQFELTLYDMSGKLHIKRYYERTNNISLDLSAFPPGIYAIRIQSADFYSSDKFILK